MRNNPTGAVLCVAIVAWLLSLVSCRCGGGEACVNSHCQAASDECANCLSSCQGMPSCCTGSGCICYEECTLNQPCPEGSEWCCSSSGDCFCMPPAQCPY